MQLLLLPLMLLLLLQLQVAAGTAVATLSRAAAAPEKCDPVLVDIEMCSPPYSHTDSTFFENKKQLSPLRILLEGKCSPFVKLFVCSMHLPMCHAETRVLSRPCKRFCTHVYNECIEDMRRYSLRWPRTMSCRDLPDQQPCFIPKNLLLTAASSSSETEQQQVQKEAGREEHGSKVSCSAAELQLLTASGAVVCNSRCHANLMFTHSDKQFSEKSMLTWSVVSFSATAIAVLTVAADGHRFEFPERPMVWVAVSHLVHSSAHLLRVGLGPQTACGAIVTDQQQQQQLYRVHRYASGWCAVIFLMIHSSWLSSCIWWAMITVCWHLCAARKWATEALHTRTVWMHTIAWGGPLLLSVMIIVLHRISADELTHLCRVDPTDKVNILLFEILPTGILLLVGCCFLISALCSSISVRHTLKWRDSSAGDVQRLEKLMTKISLFSFLFAVPALCVLGVNIYDYLLHDAWSSSVGAVLQRQQCVNFTGILQQSSSSSSGGSCILKQQPSSAVFSLKLFMSLAAGLPSGLMIWFNMKSLRTWQTCLCHRLLRQKTPQQRKQQHHQLPSGSEAWAPLTLLSNNNNNNSNANHNNSNFCTLQHSVSSQHLSIAHSAGHNAAAAAAAAAVAAGRGVDV